MPNIRLDNLPMDRQAASSARMDTEKGGGLSGPASLKAVFEKRDVDPTSHTFKRRHGSKRTTNTPPNYLGVAADINKGRIEVEHAFGTVQSVDEFSETGPAWQAFLTVRCPANSEDSYAPIFSFNGIYIYIVYDKSDNTLDLVAYNASGVAQATKGFGDTDNDTDFRIAVRRGVKTGPTDRIYLNAWAIDDDPGSDTESGSAVTFTVTSADKLILLGPLLTENVFASTPTPYDQVVLTNFSLWTGTGNAATYGNYETYASNLTPGSAGTVISSSTLRYHEAFSTGGDILAHGSVYSYLVPSAPTDYTTDAIHFGGKGVIEVPFYLDFDEYYWTPVAQDARRVWVYQLELTLPAFLLPSTVFEFQDLVRLQIVESSGSKKFKATFHGPPTATAPKKAGTAVLHSTSLTAGATYQVWVARNNTNLYLDVQLAGASNVRGPHPVLAPDPIVFNYNKSLGFVIGDTVDSENAEPFGGRIKRIALHNEDNSGAANKWWPRKVAVFYYDAESVTGDFILDRGNRGLSAHAGMRMDSAPPFYKEGGFTGAAYVAAVGGYIMASAQPSAGYVGELKKAITKDAVVQRRGSKSFLTTNGINYLINDTDKTFRPLGIPRPATKVGCVPQGVGSMDGFVRYAYRWVTKEGTIGPAYTLDPIDARGGVNVFLGADTYGIPGEAPFGVTFGECEGSEASKTAGRGVARETVETFLVRDSNDENFTDGTKSNLLATAIGGAGADGLTLEIAFRIPTFTNLRESIFSQGVMAPYGANSWMANHNPYKMQQIAGSGQEWTVQFAFRYQKRGTTINQMLFAIGPQWQHYRTTKNIGIGKDDHWKTEQLLVSIQVGRYDNDPASAAAPATSIVVCRDRSTKYHRDNDLHHAAEDYHFIDGHDYCVYVRRCVVIGNSASTSGPGEDLAISIYNKTLDDPGTVDGWAQWPVNSATPNGISTKTEIQRPEFFSSQYAFAAPDPSVRWGGDVTGHKTRVRASLGSGTFVYTRIPAFTGETAADGSGGSIMFHARIWLKAVPLTTLQIRSLDRYGARTGALSKDLEVDVAFCPDSSKAQLKGGWDIKQGLESTFQMSTGLNTGKLESCHGRTAFVGGGDDSVILAYGWDMGTDPAGGTGTGNNDFFNVTSLDNVSMWVKWTSRNEGSLSVGLGKNTVFQLATRKWYAGAEVLLFNEFAGDAVDVRQWTWITLYYRHVHRQNHATQIVVYLDKVFIDGEGGDWSPIGAVADARDAKLKKNNASRYSNQRYGLFMVGGLPGAAQKFDIELAEVRLWDGERYAHPAVQSAGGKYTFGDYISSRVPPNEWDKMWYYLRFTDSDTNDAGTAMTQRGKFQSADASRSRVVNLAQHTTDAVLIQRNAEVKDGTDDVSGTVYYVPFPEPPAASIRGIQIFRSQIIPVTDRFPNGNTNPDALTDAWRACRDAPLYALTEIPRGTTSYLDFADDTALGEELDPLSGLIPRNPRGVFEWEGYLGVYVDDRPRIHFAESPTSWESFPTNRVLDMPVREYGPIEAATEIASRDARHSRVLCMGKSWAAFIDGNPTQPLVNTLGGGVGASSPRCLVVEKGIAYSYNGTLWAISGDGQVEDIGAPVLDLLPATANARLSVSSTLSSLFVIDESSGLALRFHFMRRQWFVEDRYALSVTDVDGFDNWIHVSGYPSQGSTSVYQDDVEDNTPTGAVTVSSFSNGVAGTFVVGSITGLKVGQRLTLVADRATALADRNPLERQAITIKSIHTGTKTITCNETLALEGSFTDLNGTSHSVLYNAYVGVGEEGTLLDTGQFNVSGEVSHVDVGIDAGNGWWASFDASDFAKDPTSRSGILSAESQPTCLIDADNDGASARWGLSNRQRLQRILVWSQAPTLSGTAVGLTELELNYSRKTEG